MSIKNTPTTYGSVNKLLHWLIALLIIGMLIMGYLMGSISDKPLAGKVYNIHKLTGLLILVLMLFRIYWALINPKPRLRLDTPLWERVAEKTMHYSLYLILIIMPLAGWIMSSASGHAPHLFSFSLGLPIAKDKATDDFFLSVHNNVAIVIIVLVSIHALAAFFHHFVRKDDVLKRMLPGSSQ